MKKQYKKYKDELVLMFKEDQECIGGDIVKWNAATRKNVLRLKQIINEIGFPSSEKVGDNGELAVWLIAQHADYDIDFQERILNHFKKLPSISERKKHIAFLTDRVLVNKGKKQKYGTQFYDDSEGNFTHRPIEDEKNLNKLRKEMSLEAFEEYRKRLTKNIIDLKKK